ncbi:MAG: helix-turn-helix transcriptional regulator, partial [Parabacteroides sp.]|nr:helix-turn-helix transcriptional regulator [Parabacteroides sp.]
IIKIEREKRKWTQARLGEELNISGKQISNYEKGEPIPPMSILISLCDIFDCELGYLLGEDDYVEGSKLMTKVTEFTGLSKETIDNIKKITGTEKRCLHFGNESDMLKSILNKYLGNRSFLQFIESLKNLEEANTEYNKVFQNLEKELGTELYEEAFGYYHSQIDYFCEECEIKLDDRIYDAKKKIDQAIDDHREKEFIVKVCRYEVREEFERLIDELYPK